MPTASVKITGNVTEALAALDALGIRAEEVAGKTDTTFNRAATRTSSTFTKLGRTLGGWGIPFSESLVRMGEKIDGTDTKAARLGETMLAVSKVATVATAAGLGVAAVESIKAASKFQASTELLVTAGGELQKNLGGIRSGILQISGATGTSAEQLAEGMYLIEKAGFRAASGLKVLKASAEGAKAENVDMATMTEAVTSVMTSYHEKASQSVAVVNQMVAAAGAAKTTMQAFAGSLANVLPVASAAHLSFAQVAGAIATLTQHGTTAQESTMELANTIRGLEAPNGVAQKEMQQLGLNVNQLSTHLGKKGLTGTLQEIISAITSHMGPAGTVLMNAFRKSQSAGQDLQIMLGKMPKDLQGMSEQFLKGQMGMSDYQKAVKGLGASGYAMGSQFLALVKQSKGFNALLTSGSPAAQTFTAALKAIMGGATGMNTALMLTGENMAGFRARVGEVSDAAKRSGQDISTWTKTQQNLSVQAAELKDKLEALGISFGDKLIPAVTAVTRALNSTIGFFEKHRVAAEALGVTLGSVLVPALAVGTVGAFKKVGSVAMSATSALRGMVMGTARIVQGFRDAQAAESAFSGWQGTLGGKLRTLVTGIGNVAKSAIQMGIQFARQTVLAIRSGAVWVAEHAVQAAVFIAQNVAMAASATAAFVAENAATLGIAAGVAALVAGIVMLATHWHQVWGKVKQVTIDAMHAVQGAVSEAVSWIREHWALIVDVMLGPLGIVVTQVIKHFGQIKSGIENAFHSVIGFLSGLPGQMVQIGEHIIGGLIQGIESKVNGVLSTMRGVGNSILGAIKSPLKIFSPSKAMQEVGHHIMDGLTNGIHDRRSRLQAELKRVTADVTSINNKISAAQSFAQAFQGNAFTDVATTRSVTKAGGVMTKLINGQIVTTHAAGTTSTENLTKAQIVAAMIKDQRGQKSQALTLEAEIKKLTKEGVSKLTLGQMQAAGSSGLAQIAALASAPMSLVKQFDQLNAVTNKALQNAGAASVGARSMQALHDRQARVTDIKKAIVQALHETGNTGKKSKLRGSR